MPRATCRCGQRLSVPVDGPDRVICPKCSARVRVRRDPPATGAGDGFVRFYCPCGKRLKVRDELAASTATAPQAVKCPDCGRVVPVPSGSGALKVKGHGPETPTEELGPDDMAALERWATAHLTPRPAAPRSPTPTPTPSPAAAPVVTAAPAPASVRAEAGLRVCPRCGRPIHLSAVACRECGAPVPKR